MKNGKCEDARTDLATQVKGAISEGVAADYVAKQSASKWSDEGDTEMVDTEAAAGDGHFRGDWHRAHQHDERLPIVPDTAVR